MQETVVARARTQSDLPMAAAQPTPRTPVSYPMPPMGTNNLPSKVIATCPSRRYQACFSQELRRRYPVAIFRKKRHRPFRCFDPGAEATASECNEITHDEVLVQDITARHNVPLNECRTPLPPVPASNQRLRCTTGDAAAVNRRALLLVGVPSSPSPKGRKRRDAIRAAWMQDPLVTTSMVAVCFLLSAETPQPNLAELERERAAHGDVLLVEAPETPWLIHNATRYSNGTRRGRGMPTFKQHRFFQYAAETWPRVPYVGKFDDDTAPNLRLLVPLLHRLRCSTNPLLLIGGINWAGVVPRASAEGVRLDRCGFAWDMNGALANFGQSWGTPGITKGSGKYMEACDKRGAVLPIPYAAGAGYIFSSALLQWVGTSDAVSGWVAEARGASREALQWQKFEDTSTGYWLSYAPHTVHYVDVAPLVHDIDCHPEGSRLRDGDGTYRPPANSSLLVHNLKTPSAFAYAYKHMRSASVPYSQNECMHGVHGAPLLDQSSIDRMEQKRSATMWAHAARGEVGRLSTQHNVFLQKALREAGVACRKCRKKAMAARMVSEAAARGCLRGQAKACLARLQH